MAVTNFSPLLGLALPTTGDLSGTWGTTVNDSITQLLDSAVAGTTTLSADADVTLSTTNGAANQARNAIILWTASNGATTRNITAPAQSKAYIVINAGTGAIVIRGAGPTAGTTIQAGFKALVAWNGSDFVNVSSSVFSGIVSIEGTSSSGAQLRLFEDTDNGTNYVGLKAADAIAANVTFTLPNADGTNGQVIQTNGSGTLSFASFTGLPSQTGNDGKYLTTDGSTASWTETGAAAGGSIYVNNTTISTNYTIASGTNGFSVGPMTVSSGFAVTVSSGQRWVVI
jgi:hypothetical protein